MYENIIVNRYDAVGVVRLNRPEVGNAVSVPMLAEMARATQELDADESVRAIVLTGEGRMFCAGTELSGKGATWSEQDDWDEGGEMNLRGLATPVIAAVNGPAVGFGISVAMQCDIRIVAEDAKLGFVFVRRGIMADTDLHFWLPRLIGTTRALELLITGRIFSGAEAVQMGLATRATTKDQVLPVALELADDIAANCAPLSLAVTKSLTYAMLSETDPGRAHDVEWSTFRAMGKQPDAAEGATSFLEKRSPVWRSSKAAVKDMVGRH